MSLTPTPRNMYQCYNKLFLITQETDQTHQKDQPQISAKHFTFFEIDMRKTLKSSGSEPVEHAAGSSATISIILKKYPLAKTASLKILIFLKWLVQIVLRIIIMIID